VTQRRKALVIAEEGPGREGAVRQLAALGYAAEQASPGFAAGAAAARFDPDVVVLHATSADGGEVLRAVRLDRELGDVPVVGVGRSDWQEALRAAGCAAVVADPLADGALGEAVARALASAAPRTRARDEPEPPRSQRRRRAGRASD
jgi:CheY-like chemotaxis protein